MVWASLMIVVAGVSVMIAEMMGQSSSFMNTSVVQRDHRHQQSLRENLSMELLAGQNLLFPSSNPCPTTHTRLVISSTPVCVATRMLCTGQGEDRPCLVRR